MDTDLSYRDRKHVVWGVLLISVGVLVLLDNLGWMSIEEYWHFWPLVLVVLGLNKMVDFSSPKQFSDGLMLAVIGCWLYVVFENLWGLSFQNSWPIILIACGVNLMLKPILQSNAQARLPSNPTNPTNSTSTLHQEHHDGK